VVERWQIGGKVAKKKLTCLFFGVWFKFSTAIPPGGTQKELVMSPKYLKNAQVQDMKLHNDKSSYIVAMSNALVQSGYSLSLNEKRLVALAASKIDSRKATLNSLSIRVTAGEFEKTYDISQKHSFRDLRAAGRSLFERKITFIEQGKKGQIITDIRWVNKAKYYEGEGWIELQFYDELVPHLTKLTKRFTTYKLEQSKALKKIYSWRILELMMMHKSHGHFEMNLDEFIKILELPKSYQKFSEMRRKVLEPSVKELSKNSGYAVEYTALKAGRKVKRLVFDFHPQKQQDLFDN